ncbi:hypothetical protein [uncultured Brachyspira sp.]|uniref:hypothetical protein n=1 Tax=uncultured Brachyspira sp. TaxID=221953 RepID=UPI0027DB5001|nr:hypothetical protein [uncultured Brachyspira sp.]
MNNVIASRRPHYVLKLTSLVVYFFTAKLFITTLTKLYFIWLATLQAFYLVNPQAQKLVHLKLNHKGGSIMTQKNKIFSITLSLLILGSVACRKNGGGGITQTDPIRSITGNLLIVSADGTKGANPLPLSFVGANAAVSDVKVDKFGEQGGDILLFPTNFIIENGNLYLTNLTTTNKEGKDIEAAKTNSKVILTFSLSGENLSRYIDTADIFVGKYSNIYTTTFDGFTNLTTITSDDIADAAGGHTTEKFKLEFTKMTNATTNESILILENSLDGYTANNIDTQKFIEVVSNRMYNNSIGNFKTYFNDFKFVSFDTKDSESIGRFKIDLTKKIVSL